MSRTKSSAPNVLAVAVTVVGRVATAAVTLDGAIVDAEVQWWAGTPFRTTTGGEISLINPDPAMALSAARFQRRTNLQVTARLLVGESYIYSETAEADIAG